MVDCICILTLVAFATPLAIVFRANQSAIISRGPDWLDHYMLPGLQPGAIC